jgi:hypothetical protein
MAKAGWQPTGILVKPGESYEFAAKGTWRIDGTGTSVSADGGRHMDERKQDAGPASDRDDRSAEGEGQLVAAIFHDFVLSPELPLGERGEFKAPAEGQLFLRCRESWSRIGDNAGQLTAHFRMAK